VLRDMRDRCLNVPGKSQPDVREWLRGLTGDRSAQ
jgi:hypothetical protein